MRPSAAAILAVRWVLARLTIGWAELRDNRHDISADPIAGDDRMALFLMDYAARRRPGPLGQMMLVEAAPGRAREAHRAGVGRVAACDRNCGGRSSGVASRMNWPP